jgi:hypothetical protein
MVMEYGRASEKVEGEWGGSCELYEAARGAFYGWRSWWENWVRARALVPFRMRELPWQRAT